MEFKTREDAYALMKRCKYLDGGSQGKCYVDRRKGLVYKFYQSFLDPIDDNSFFTEEEVLAFKHIKSDMFVFPYDVMKQGSEVIGDISIYKDAINLYKLNPLTVDLNRLLSLCEIAIKEVELITRQSVNCYDMLYNIMLGDRLYVVDSLDDSLRERDYNELLLDNMEQFNVSIIDFLISNLFENVIKENRILQEMCDSKCVDTSITIFITELKKYLSELVGREITFLNEAIRYRNKEEIETDYKRLILI